MIDRDLVRAGQCPVPDGTNFQDGLSSPIPWWKIQGRWFHDDANECVVGSALAATMPGVTAKKLFTCLAGRLVTQCEANSGATQAIALKVSGYCVHG